MLALPGVTLACVDTANHALALRALARSLSGIRFARAVLLTDAMPQGLAVPDGVDIVAIAPVRSRDDYSAFVLKHLLPHVPTPHVLLVQWDGYVVNPAAWDPEFLACDYVGARWSWFTDGHDVGNGGFSLRSRRLLEALQDPRIVLADAEDLTIGRAFRPLLEREHGIRYAAPALADRFSFEAAYPVGQPFGFHGLFNFCRVVPPPELAAMASAFPPATARSPQFAQLLRNCIALGQWAPAIAIARRILGEMPDQAEAQALLAQAESALARGTGIGRNDPCPCGSGKRFKQCHGALAVLPTATAAPSADALVSRGMAAHQQGALAAAESDYRAALAAQAGHPHALHYLGVIAYQQGQPANALPLLERSAALVPQEPEFHNNLGLALAALDRNAEAAAAYRRALALKPDHATAWNNLGLVLQADNALPDAIAAFRQALAAVPSFPQARWNLALALLAHGEFAEGWRAYEARLELAQFAPLDAPPATPLWDGRDPAGRTLLLRAEQGLGDAIQFVRLATVLAARGARVLVQAPRALAGLFGTVPGVADVIASGAAAPPHDAWLPLLSLAGALGIDEASIPATVPYLRVDADRRAAIAAAIGPATGTLRVGLAWAGNPRNANDRRRSAPLAALAPLFASSGVRWFSLQKGDGEEQLAAVPAAAGLVTLPARDDLDGTAALIDALDLVVTVDTSIAHLAGALARPALVLLPFAADWRWRTARNDSAWYPTLRLFRQPAPGDWDSVVAAVAAALGERVRAS